MDTVEVIKDLLVRFGAGWVLWLLFLLSAISVAIAIERAMYFRRKGADIRQLAQTLDRLLPSASLAASLAALQEHPSAAATVASAGLRLRDRGVEAAEKGMRGALAMERKGLEMRLAFLGTLGNNAPFIGLFGTVIGVILAFHELGQATAATGGAANQAASAAVMSAISEALVATAVGIGVALPAVAAYNFFQRQIAVLLDDAEALMNLVLAYLSSNGKSAADDQSGWQRSEIAQVLDPLAAVK
ncbi:MAG TPA: MotA/TolQ/ExbB proton channel family protein [Terriglobales bacterium]|nr:MotA/TolQ/ExbB proton channel family protein [Terriglobales bacterium]